MREYYADVARTWEIAQLFANDFRAIPGAVVVMGRIEDRLDGEPSAAARCWTWKVQRRQGDRCALRRPRPRGLTARRALRQRRLA